MERRGLGKQLTLYVDYQCVHCMTNINDLSDLLLTDFKVIGMKKNIPRINHRILKLKEGAYLRVFRLASGQTKVVCLRSTGSQS